MVSKIFFGKVCSLTSLAEYRRPTDATLGPRLLLRTWIGKMSSTQTAGRIDKMEFSKVSVKSNT